MKKIPELLAPAGNYRALEAALEGGADAIYFGASRFNARMRAGNFSDEETEAAIKLCHTYGVKAYAAMNIRILDRELCEALSLAKDLYSSGIDALIVADGGLAAEIRKILPNIELHASTQLSGSSYLDARYLSENGFSRMVCPREISKEGLTSLCERSPIEIEMFCHGAYCVSFSGQCLMSAVMGGRSGNRGSCAQPCRQPYTMNGKKGYPISLKDMCLASHIESLVDSGVASLKLEGRQKPCEYVYRVTSIYRRLLDECRNATKGEITELERIFSREGFSSGYYTASPKNMIGVRTLEQYNEGDKFVFSGLERKIPLDMKIEAVIGEPIKCTAFVNNRSVTVCGDTVVKSEGVAEMTEDGARECAARLGNTSYELRRFEFTSDSEALVTRSILNKLRRSAIEALGEGLCRDVETVEIEYSPKKIKDSGEYFYTAEFVSRAQIPENADDFFEEIYLPFGRETDDTVVSLPPVDFESAERILKNIKNGRCMVHSFGELYAALRFGIVPTASHRFNVFNSASAEQLIELGADKVFLSPELTLAQIRDIGIENKGAVVYGRLPLMTLCRCAISNGGENCRGRGEGMMKSGVGAFCQSEIVDRKGVKFPIIATPECINIVYNSVPVYMADKKSELDRAKIKYRHFVFSVESKEECSRIIEAYKNGWEAENTEFTRLK